MKSVLPFFYPTEVILIDDEPILVDRVKMTLGLLSVSIKSFNHPLKALDYINDHNQIPITTYALENGYHQIYSSKRFKQIATVVVDYDMPGMNGLEVCRQITSPYIQKIMLTGAATHQIAVDAFNEGIIHQFIQKNDPDVFAKLQNAVISAQEKYFEACTFELIHQLQNDYPEVSILQNPDFIELFGKITHENKVIEHYLLDEMGSFLFLPDSGKSSALFVFNEEILDTQEDMIPELDRHPDIVEDIYKHRKAICFYPFNSLEKYDPANWKNYLQPLKHLGAKSPLFYAFVSDLTDLDQSKIVSFKDYRSKKGRSNKRNISSIF
jgi:CheY-like chemotaxis protein